MVKVSKWCLPTTGGVLHITIGMIRKVTHFNGKIPLFYNMMYTQIFHKHIYQVFLIIYQCTVLLYELISKKTLVLSIETYS